MFADVVPHPGISFVSILLLVPWQNSSYVHANPKGTA